MGNQQQAAQIALQQLIEKVNQIPAGGTFHEASPSLKAFLDTPLNEGATHLLLVAQHLAEITSPTGAGILAVWLGGEAESGGNPAPIIPYLLNYFFALGESLNLPMTDDEDVIEQFNETFDDNDERVQGIQYLGQSLVAHVARCPDQWEILSNDDALLERLDHYAAYSYGATWLSELLKKHSDTLLVLNVAHKIGIRVRYENLSNCFHLFSLLQGALEKVMPDARQADPELLLAAKGKPSEGSDDAWWHYGIATVPEATLLASVWGEMSPKALPVIQGERIILLWEAVLGRREWDTGFFHPFLEAVPPHLELLEQLSHEEVALWFERLALDV